MQKVIILGGVGNGTVIAQAIRHANMNGCNELSVAGFFSDRVSVGEQIEGLPILAETSRESIESFFQKGFRFIYTIYRIDGQAERLKLFEDIGLTGEKLATFIHPSAYVAPDVIMAPGCVLMPMVMVSSHTRIGMGSIVMVGASIGHNTEIGQFNHIAAQAVVGAYITTGVGVHVGLNSTIRENITIGTNSTVGMGSVLTKNIGDNEIWIGNPARFLRNAH